MPIRFPILKDVPMENWGGRLCLSRNAVPVFGAVDNNLFAVCCHNGLGTAKGTISGKLIAELASGQCHHYCRINKPKLRRCDCQSSR